MVSEDAVGGDQLRLDAEVGRLGTQVLDAEANALTLGVTS